MARKNGKGAADRITRTERQRKAVEMRRAGYTYDEIALRLGVGKTTAYRDVTRYLQEARASVREDAENMLELERERLEALLKAAWEDAEQGEPRAIQAVLRILEALRKNLGLDAPAVAEDSTPRTTEEIIRTLSDEMLDELAQSLSEPREGAIN
ncbi:MAG: hypothetical protein GXP48_09295 [Acidobacteria bacterium]|nr:hypothetical protein [Acidobacteriota bacterium]